MLRKARNAASLSREEAAHRLYVGSRTLAEAIGGLAAWGKNLHSGLSGEDIMAEYEKIGLLDCLGESCGMHALCQGKSMVSGDIKLREAVPGLM